MKKKKKKVESPSAERLEKKLSGYEGNRLLLRWLEEDKDRGELYTWVNSNKFGGSIVFDSRDNGARDCDHCGLEKKRDDPHFEHKPVTLVTSRQEIERILEDKGKNYSNRVYAELGGGNFMLALDPKMDPTTPPDAHAAQREAYKLGFTYTLETIQELSRLACADASIMALRGPDFDVAQFAEQSAVRFCQKLLGYSFTDYPKLEAYLRAAYRGLVYQVLGRHFVSDPTAVPEAKQALGRLLARTSVLIDAYEAKDEDALKGCTDKALPGGFEPVMKRLAAYQGPLNGEQLAVIVAGAAVGSVGNVQAAACIVVKSIFANPARLKRARVLAREKCGWGEKCPKHMDREAMQECKQRPTCQYLEWKGYVDEALRQNPPIPFLPRLEVDSKGKVVKEILLALGGGTQGSGVKEDPMVWGLSESGKHWCVGKELAWPLIIEIVRQVMLQPGLAERLDPEDAEPFGLTKRWGFACESYPLTHQRERRIAQSTLNVAMRLKSPIKDNADRVREVIRSGAPRIEEALRGAKHVHFAWFELIESDSVLVLHTVYDGPFMAYIEHFALKVGDLFDALFECIETPPPMPVDKFPNEFVAHIQRFNRSPTMGYFFSAYPRSDVARILRDELARP